MEQQEAVCLAAGCGGPLLLKHQLLQELEEEHVAGQGAVCVCRTEEPSSGKYHVFSFTLDWKTCLCEALSYLTMKIS